MRQKSNHPKDSAEKAVKDIRRQTRRRYSPEERIRIVLEGLRGEDSIAELCRKEGINPNLYSAGPRSSWRQVRNGWPEIPREKPPPMR